MAELVIQNIPDEEMTRLRELAAAHAVTVDTEARALLMRQLTISRNKREELLERIRKFRNAMPPYPEGFEMREAIKEGRE